MNQLLHINGKNRINQNLKNQIHQEKISWHTGAARFRRRTFHSAKQVCCKTLLLVSTHVPEHEDVVHAREEQRQHRNVHGASASGFGRTVAVEEESAQPDNEEADRTVDAGQLRTAEEHGGEDARTGERPAGEELPE